MRYFYYKYQYSIVSNLWNKSDIVIIKIRFVASKSFGICIYYVKKMTFTTFLNNQIRNLEHENNTKNLNCDWQSVYVIIYIWLDASELHACHSWSCIFVDRMSLTWPCQYDTTIPLHLTTTRKKKTVRLLHHCIYGLSLSSFAVVVVVAVASGSNLSNAKNYSTTKISSDNDDNI